MTSDGPGLFEVRYQDRWRHCGIELPSEPLLPPPGLAVVEAGARFTAYGPPAVEGGLGAADVIAGAVPLLFLENKRVTLAHLQIPPPAPLSSASLQAMWDEVAALDVPLPASVMVQGRGLPGRLTAADTLLQDALDRAHSAARMLLARWPESDSEVVRWRGLELPGGREDLRLTSTGAGRLPGQPGPQGQPLPVRSARRLYDTKPWSSRRLWSVAESLAQAVDSALDRASARDRELLLRPFVGVARLARPRLATYDPPVSTWPAVAVSTFRAMTAALAVLDTTQTSDAVTPEAPLCHLWRLYEAWVATRCASIMDRNPARTRTSAPHPLENAEWMTSWHEDDGTQLFFLAQPQITGTVRDFGGALPVGVRSISSDLRPDVLICVVVPSKGSVLVALDAKRRSAAYLDARDVAEAASKYVWGLRVGGEESSSIDVSQTLLATTANTVPMHDPVSRIGAARLVPAESDSDFGIALEEALSSAKLMVSGSA